MSVASADRVGLIGRLDRGGTLCDGQTVKTRMTYRLLAEALGEGRIVVADTNEYQRHPFRVGLALVRCLLSCQDVVVLLSRRGRSVLFPLLAAAARWRGVRIHHSLIAGRLAADAAKRPYLVKCLNDFNVNWVESRRLADELTALGVKNARYLPNFKYYDESPRGERTSETNVVRFCMFGRVTPIKGVENAVWAIESIAEKRPTLDVALDVYGPVDPQWADEFEHLITTCPHSRYCGTTAPEEAIRVLAEYDALLFPTTAKYEGIPGTIIDALSAGLPVIASKWLIHDEMLEDGVTGFSYELGEDSQLVPTIERFLDLEDRGAAFRQNCLRRAADYTPDGVREAFLGELGVPR